MKRSASIIAGAFLALLPAAAWATYGQFDIHPTYVYTRQVTLEGGVWTTFETTDLEPLFADTTMHLWDPDSGQQVAGNDDCEPGTLRSCLIYRSTTIKEYLLVIRSHDPRTAGECTVKQNGVVLDEATPFGGSHEETDTQRGDIVQTVLVHQGATDTVLFGFNSDDHLIAIDEDGGVGYASKLFSGLAPIARVIVGTPTPGPALPARLVVNDAYHDWDGDGLGKQLENFIRTCDSDWDPYRPDCVLIPYMAVSDDTDGDGIRDDCEVLGIERDPNDPDDFPQQLPAWGADPRHKDVFVEMDWEILLGHVPAAVALEAVNTYDRFDTEVPLGNPDGVRGVDVHLDIGAGDDGAGGTRYGNWGGAQHTPGVAYQPNGVPNLTYQQFVRSRRRVFHWGWARGREGGQATIRGWDFWVDHTKGRYGIAHELGHNLGLDHGGTAAACLQNGKPNYRSIMNYAAEKMGATTFSLGEMESPSFLDEHRRLACTS